MRLLNHRTHSSIKNQNAIFRDFIERNSCSLGLTLSQSDDLFYLAIVLVLVLVLLDDSHGLLHFPFIVEVHFKMHALATDII